MSSSEIPEDIQNFVKKYIHSVGDLDVLLLIFKDTQKLWSSEEVSKTLRTNEPYASTQLRQFAAHGLLQVHSSAPALLYQAQFSKDAEHKVLRIQELYKIKTSALIRLIYTQPVDAIQQMAEAFKIKKD